MRLNICLVGTLYWQTILFLYYTTWEPSLFERAVSCKAAELEVFAVPEWHAPENICALQLATWARIYMNTYSTAQSFSKLQY